MNEVLSPENVQAIKSIAAFLNDPLVSYYLQAVGAICNAALAALIVWRGARVAVRAAGAVKRKAFAPRQVDPLLANVLWCLEDPEIVCDGTVLKSGRGLLAYGNTFKLSSGADCYPALTAKEQSQAKAAANKAIAYAKERDRLRLRHDLASEMLPAADEDGFQLTLEPEGDEQAAPTKWDANGSPVGTAGTASMVLPTGWKLPDSKKA